jgi:hypothetical protein
VTTLADVATALNADAPLELLVVIHAFNNSVHPASLRGVCTGATAGGTGLLISGFANLASSPIQGNVTDLVDGWLAVHSSGARVEIRRPS